MSYLNNPATQSVVVKSQFQDRVVSLDLSTLTSTVSTVVSYAVSPISNPALTVTIGAITGTSVSVQLAGGIDNTSYGCGLVITDSAGNLYQHTIAILVKDTLSIKYQETNPFAFQSLIDSIEIGGAAVGKASFILPAGTEATNGYVTWSLLDKEGTVYSNGNAYEYKLNTNSTYVAVEAMCVVNAPSDMESDLSTDHYQIRWELNNVLSSPIYAFENVDIQSTYSVPTGAQDTVEMFGDLATLSIVLPKPYEQVSLSIYTSVGSNLIAQAAITSSYRVSNGYYYEANFDTSSVPVSLDPYILSWKYNNSTGQSNRDTGQLFVVNASILRATKSVEAAIAKARTTLLNFKDELFTPSVIVTMLARGRDTFNGASGHFTSFTMTNADSFIREYWLKYTQVELLQAQYLLEGEKAYTFSGQAISLERDVTQYYQSMANDLKQALDADMKSIKQNMLIKGLSGGDGSTSSVNTRGSMGSVGISISPASTYNPLLIRNFR